MTRSIHVQCAATSAALFLAASAAHAQIASAIVREGIQVPNGPAGETITSITSVMTNNAGGYAVRMDSTGSGTTLSHVWGNASGGPGAVFRTEGTYAGYTQTAFETFFGVDDAGQVAYSPTLTVGDSVWLDGLPIVVETQPASIPGIFWRFGSRPLITASGVPYCVAGLTSTSGGSTQSYAFVKGTAGTVLFQSGDTLPGMPGPIGTSSTPVDFDYAVSAGDVHYILTVKLDNPPSTLADEYVIYDGSVLTIGGVPIVEGTAVPAAIGGVGGENWGTFDFFACTDGGRYLFTGDTDAATTADEYLLVDGVFRHREGDVIDTYPTVSGIQTATMNEAGTVAYVWEVATSSGNLEALFWEDQIVLMEGDAVDLDGDGVVEPTSIVTDIGETRQLALAANGDLYVQCLVDTMGTASTSDDVDAIFHVAAPVSAPTVYCTAGTTTNGCVPSISASAQPSVSLAHACSIDVAGLEGAKQGLIFYGTSGPNATPWGSGGTSFLCVKAPTQRTPNQNSGGTLGACDGALTLDWNAYQAAHPLAVGQPWSVGDQAWVQGWFRDPPATKTTNLTDAVALTYVP